MQKKYPLRQHCPKKLTPLEKRSQPSYIARNIKIDIKPGQQNIPTIGISTKPLVEGNITVEEMTLEEMVDAGIDISAPGNNHVFKYSVIINFDSGIDVLSLLYYFNGEGACLGGKRVDDNNQETDTSVEPGEGIVSITLPGRNNGNEGIPFKLKNGSNLTVFPVSENFYLIVYGEVRWLKEMFNVELLVINNSMTDTIENCNAELALPDGLSLATMKDGSQKLSKNIGTIEGASCKSVNWYIRGDKEGDYDISAKVSGTMMPFSEDFSYEYRAGNSISVYAGNAMHMTITMPTATYYNDDYPIKIEIENVSDRVIYGISHSIKGLKQGKITCYSDDTVKEESLFSLSLANFIRAGIPLDFAA